MTPMKPSIALQTSLLLTQTVGFALPARPLQDDQVADQA
ncbi:MAG: hypothetical protein ACI9F9_000527 [Candidatus Paceibacteria bacterium]|jgi:hypothetical protein